MSLAETPQSLMGQMTGLRTLGKILPKLSPAHFAIYASQGIWKPFAHLLILQQALLRCLRGEVKRLIISLPPQHGKSEFTSHYFIAWLLGCFPDLRLIFASYEAGYAANWGRKVRDTLTEHQALFGVEISKASKAANRWHFAGRRGYMVSAGIGGPINGRAADVAIIDDPIKNAEEASSPTIRQRHKDWLTNVLLTRLSQMGFLILIMTRWHEDDLAGFLAEMSKQSGVPCELVVIPAICPDPSDMPDGAIEYFGSDPLGRQPGDALCPELHSVEKLNAHRKDMGEGAFWALYQQYPFTPRGGVFAGGALRFWISENPLEPNEEGVWCYKPGVRKFDKMIQSWDFTYGSLTGRSRCVGQVWGKMGPDYWLLYQVRDRLTFDEMLLAVEDLTERFPLAKQKLIESKASGPQVIRTLRKKISGILPVNPRGCKRARAESVAYLVRSNNVWVPHPTKSGMPWVPAFIQELTAFPLATTDDQVDTLSQALSHLDAGGYKAHKNKPKGL